MIWGRADGEQQAAQQTPRAAAAVSQQGERGTANRAFGDESAGVNAPGEERSEQQQQWQLSHAVVRVVPDSWLMHSI